VLIAVALTQVGSFATWRVLRQEIARRSMAIAPVAA
jgi:hypothetical protein